MVRKDAWYDFNHLKFTETCDLACDLSYRMLHVHLRRIYSSAFLWNVVDISSKCILSNMFLRPAFSYWFSLWMICPLIKMEWFYTLSYYQFLPLLLFAVSISLLLHKEHVYILLFYILVELVFLCDHFITQRSDALLVFFMVFVLKTIWSEVNIVTPASVSFLFS